MVGQKKREKKPMENVELDEDLAESRLIVIYHNDVCWISKIC